MITAALLATFGITLAPALEDANPNSRVEFEDSIALELSIEETHFAAQSLAQVPLMLIFASEDHAFETAFWLPPGARYDEDFARGTLNGLIFEVLTPAESGWSVTGSISFTDSLPQDGGQLWLLDCGHFVAGRGEGEALAAVAPAGSLLPPRLNSFSGPGNNEASVLEGHSHPKLMHVPAPTPTDKPKGNLPPKLRKKPLPPV